MLAADSLAVTGTATMNRFRVPAIRVLSITITLLSAASISAQQPAAVVWEIDNLKMIGGHKVTVVGSPRVVAAPGGKGVEFDGVDDALFVDSHPVAGWQQFTAEVVFQPAAAGPKEQRFFHLQEQGSENRVLFETRLTDDGQWFLDTYIKSDGGECTLYAENHRHKIGPWHHAAIVVDGQTMRHYVNGQLELSKDLKFVPHKPGQTSLGVRFNKVHWYKGAISRARFTPRVLPPGEFLKAVSGQ
jgi:hypothetical protein